MAKMIRVTRYRLQHSVALFWFSGVSHLLIYEKYIMIIMSVIRHDIKCRVLHTDTSPLQNHFKRFASLYCNAISHDKNLPILFETNIRCSRNIWEILHLARIQKLLCFTVPNHALLCLS
jgi:hypothetical protein